MVTLFLRRPLFVALVFGCTISLMDAGRLTLRLALPAAIWWTWVPLLEILSLYAASPTARRMPWRPTIDAYFRSHTLWLVWLIAFSAYWAFLPAETAFAWLWRHNVWYIAAAIVVTWGAWLDYGFFRQILKRSPWQAGRELFFQRLLAWISGAAIFAGTAGWQTLATKLGL